MPGLFITFEGGEGTGKSTQLRRLALRLMDMKHRVVETREPGGTKDGEIIRSLLVSGDIRRWSAQSEALLNYVARETHLAQVIRPALADGKTVLCDRFMDSTRVYQGYAGGCPEDLIAILERAIVGNTRPALTLVLDLDPSVGLARAGERGNAHEQRYERKGLTYHQRLREGFQLLTKAEPERCRLIDAGGTAEDVHGRIWREVAKVAFYG